MKSDLRYSVNKKILLFFHFDISSVTLTVNTNQNDPYKAEIHRVVQARDVTLTVNTNLTTPLKSKSVKPFRLESEKYSNLTPKIRHFCHSHSKYESNDTSQVKIHQAV
ncbi:hypothetical protein SFRURICE_014509 [Spodoptera frugiperda]|nr:hypothetical protein SFRURICE_014509 [Spodoptera frugiperda]